MVYNQTDSSAMQEIPMSYKRTSSSAMQEIPMSYKRTSFVRMPMDFLNARKLALG